eukprot:TRINITY_DN3704_c0_g1_i1.p1 TRINITY_DN3704_c0_g1~~TRINITY_DN3704_c0_g1_i1.p1  ORF type:complete len:292 (-),score=37.17 TRINITY_DN3704_c0_g1_i1:258-1133(-)
MSDPKKTNKQEGWLKKRGDKGIVKGWKNRFFVLEADPDKLYYYRSRGDPKPLGFIELSKVFSLHKTNDGAFGFAVCVPGRIYYLQAFSEGERAKWLEYFVDQTKLPIGDENTKPSTKKPKDPNAPDESSSEESKEGEEKSKKKDKKKDKELQSSSSNNNLASNPQPQSDTAVVSPHDTTSNPDSPHHKTSSGSMNNTNGATPEGSKSRTDSLDDANAGSAETPPADIQRGKGSAVGDSYNSATVSSPPDPLLITSVENLDLSKDDSFSSFTFRPTDKDTVPPPSDAATQTS